MYGDDEHRRFGIPQQRNEALDRQTPQDLLPIGARKIRDGAPVAPGACNPFLLPEPISQPQAVM